MNTRQRYVRLYASPGLGISPLLIGAAGLSTAYVADVWLRDRLAAKQARDLANKLGKPLLNVGCGYVGPEGKSSFTGAKLWGDVNCDLAAPKYAPCGPNTVCHCDLQDLSRFKDKQFGVVLASNVLRYVPDRARALAELCRVADHVVVSSNALNWPQWGPGPALPVD